MEKILKAYGQTPKPYILMSGDINKCLKCLLKEQFLRTLKKKK